MKVEIVVFDLGGVIVELVGIATMIEWSKEASEEALWRRWLTRILLERARAALEPDAALELARAIEQECGRLIERPPNVDFAIVALRRALGLPNGSALTLIAIARSAGWIAHAIEQYTSGRLIRPRARYNGESP